MLNKFSLAKYTFSSVLAGFFVSIITFSSAGANSNEEAYTILKTITEVAFKENNTSGCPVLGTIDFDGFYAQLPVFREAWLNKDYSVDFYNQRRKQIFVYTVVKRFAEILTEALYRDKDPSECQFSVRAKYLDKFGKPNEIPVMTWRFTSKQNTKVDWDKIDPRDFAELALDFKISPEANAWMSDEPSLEQQPAQGTTKACDAEMPTANATFLRATTYCKKDYMDSEAGYYALKKAKECDLSEEALKKTFVDVVKRLDEISRKRGRAAVCEFVLQAARN
jgi:hypothetical protein